MDAELAKIEEWMERFTKEKHEADDAESRHKNLTAGLVKEKAVDVGIGRAKEEVMSDPTWLASQVEVNRLNARATWAKYKMEQAIREWETARSVYAATRRVT